MTRLIDKIAATGADAWASAVELLIWLSRSPEFWADGACSASFNVWATDHVHEVEVRRQDVLTPLHRDDLMPA